MDARNATVATVAPTPGGAASTEHLHALVIVYIHLQAAIWCDQN